MKSGLEKRCRDARNTTQGHAAARTGRYSELARVVDVFVPARQDRSGGQVLRNGRPGRMPQMQHQPRQRQRVFQPVLSRNLCQTRTPAAGVAPAAGLGPTESVEPTADAAPTAGTAPKEGVEPAGGTAPAAGAMPTLPPAMFPATP